MNDQAHQFIRRWWPVLLTLAAVAASWGDQRAQVQAIREAVEELRRDLRAGVYSAADLADRYQAHEATDEGDNRAARSGALPWPGGAREVGRLEPQPPGGAVFTGIGAGIEKKSDARAPP